MRSFAIDFAALERAMRVQEGQTIMQTFVVGRILQGLPRAKPKGDVFTRIAAQRLEKAYDDVTLTERAAAKALWATLLYTLGGEETLKAIHGEHILSPDWEDRHG